MADYGVTDDGFVLKRLDTIMSEINNELTQGFGVETSVQKPSFLNTLIVTFSNQIAELWETAQDSYYAKFPATASGLNLDNAVQLGGVTRKKPLPTTYPLHCTGVDGTTVTTSIRVGSDTNPQITLVPVKQFTITRDSFNAAIIRVVSTEQAAFTVTINGNVYSYSSEETDDALSILQALQTLITLDGYKVSINEDENLVIEDNTKTRSNVLILTDNLTTVTVTTIANFQTEEDGVITLVNGSITQMVDNMTGFTGVNNLITPSYGREEETDAELRSSYVSKAYLRSETMIDSIASALLEEIDDVISVSGSENYTDETDVNGLPPHSIEMIVEGGDDYAIADIILGRKAAGINTYGSTAIDTSGKYQDTITIRFSRPTHLYTWFKVVLHGKSGAIAKDYDTLTITSIMNYVGTLVAGDDLLTQKLIEGIYDDVAGVTFVDILVATTTDKTVVPEEPDYLSGNVEATIRQLITTDSSRIEVKLNGDS